MATQIPLFPRTRAEINRENARKSTGPKSDAAKKRLKMVSFKHGLTGQTLTFLEGEEDSYARMLAGFHKQYEPVNEMEWQLVQRINDVCMRLNRSAAIDFNLYGTRTQQNDSEEVEDERAAGMLAQTVAWAQNEDSFEKLGRYEARLTRQLVAYRRELALVQAERKSQVKLEVRAVQAPQLEHILPDNYDTALICKTADLPAQAAAAAQAAAGSAPPAYAQTASTPAIPLPPLVSQPFPPLQITM